MVELDSNAFNLIEGDSIGAPVIQARCLGGGVSRHTLSVFKFRVWVREIGCDARAAKAVIADSGGFYSCLFYSALNHP